MHEQGKGQSSSLITGLPSVYERTIFAVLLCFADLRLLGEWRVYNRNRNRNQNQNQNQDQDKPSQVANPHSAYICIELRAAEPEPRTYRAMPAWVVNGQIRSGVVVEGDAADERDAQGFGHAAKSPFGDAARSQVAQGDLHDPLGRDGFELHKHRRLRWFKGSRSNFVDAACSFR